MKKFMLLMIVAAILLSMAACGQSEASSQGNETVSATEPEVISVDVSALYNEMAEVLPQMIELDETMLMNFCGIDAADCAQYAASICYDGLRTDEVWVIEAVSEEAMERIVAMADNRLIMKGEETVSYSPEQYKVGEKAKVIRNGLYFALIVSPDVDSLADMVSEAFGL